LRVVLLSGSGDRQNAHGNWFEANRTLAAALEESTTIASWLARVSTIRHCRPSPTIRTRCAGCGAGTRRSA